MIKDKTGRTNGRLAYGWCLDGAEIPFNTTMIDNTDFWISFYTDDDFTLSNINGNSTNTISCVSGVLTWTENDIDVESVAIPFDGFQHRITLSRYQDKIRVFFDYQTLASTQLSTTIPTGTTPEFFTFTGISYDVRISDGNPLSGITENYTNETAWFPCQEGLDTTIYDVLSPDDVVVSCSWVNDRMYAFYNQFYGFTLSTGVIVPNQFFGVKEKKYIYDDGQTWYSFIGNMMDKNNYVGNTFGYPEVFNDLIHLSDFYPYCAIKNDYKMWNIKELYKIVFDTYLPTGANYSFFSKRFLDDDGYPVGIAEMLFYSRQVFTSEENYLYAYLLNDDRSDDPNKYVLPDENNKYNVSYADQVVLGGTEGTTTYYLKYE